MQINTHRTGTTTTAIQQATATNPAPMTANVTTAATGREFEVLKGSTPDPFGGSSASPDDASAEAQGAMSKAAQLLSMISTLLNPPATKTD